MELKLIVIRKQEIHEYIKIKPHTPKTVFSISIKNAIGI